MGPELQAQAGRDVAAPQAAPAATTFLGRLPGQLAIWAAICAASAGPSFFVANSVFIRPAQTAAMAAGIAAFVLAYALAGSSDLAARLRRRKLLRRSLYIGYGTRIAVSLLSAMTPIFFVDVLCGLLSVTITGLGDRSSAPALLVFITTIVQGIILNIVLIVYMLIVYGIQIGIFGINADRVRDGCCKTCGYDLRASRELCPECGTAFQPPAPAA